MYRKNTSGQFVGFQLLLTATGAIATGLTPTVRRCIDGTFAAATGTVTEDTGTGGYKFAMSQADTNGNDISFWFTATGAMPVCVNIVTTAADPTDSVRLGLTALPNAAASAIGGLPLSVDTSGRVDVLKINGTSQTARDIGASVITASGTVTTVTNQLTAAQIATGVWQDAVAGDFTTASSIGKSLYTSGNAPGAASGIALVGSNMGTITGALTAAQIATGVWQDATAGDFTTASSIGKSLYNAFGANTSVYTVAALANAPSGTGASASAIATAVWQDATAGDFTVAGSIGKSIMNGVALGTGLTVNDITTKTGYSLSGTQTFNNTGTWSGNIVGTLSTLTTYTGNTVQTGDAYARLGAPAGASHAADVAAVKVDTAAVKVQTDKMTFTVANQIDANPLSINGNASAASNLSKSAKAIVRGTCSGGSTTTAVVSSMTTPATLTAAGQLIGRTILFDDNTTTAALQGQASNITNNTTGATPTITFTAMTTAPANTDTFSIL